MINFKQDLKAFNKTLHFEDSENEVDEYALENGKALKALEEEEREGKLREPENVEAKGPPEA